jgi:GAF domain-containing protein
LQTAVSPLQVFAAAEGEIVEVQPSRSKPSERSTAQFPATAPVEPALAERSVLLGVADPSMATVLSEAIRAEGIRFTLFSTIDEARQLINKDRPSLVILEHDKTRADGMATCRAIREIKDHETPVVMVAAQEDPGAGIDTGVSDWLIKPFTSSYARTKIRAWVLRTECRWIRATIPDDEERRIASMRALKILDTEPEERFDRVTRLAAALFNVPMAAISLVDENRQWFKSCLGLTAKETPRDAAFCAHVVYSREPMIVPDAFQDVRFADNPLVINEPRIRFYAGYPLMVDGGSCIGTLCLLDTRPRTLEGPDLERLHDLADIAVREILGLTTR